MIADVERTPPWAFRADHPPSSMYWRMGSGEDYMAAFFAMWKYKSRTERVEYFQRHPPSTNWEGWSTRVIDWAGP